ncbi:uncharacterized protein K452DRAFT_307666 [Aplosporella prunicola CBS 121167]|uniref:MATH domain-containing protein n=1 Tax=Aplosporella prunicola CBS 121167 TaxID=1176127 RepID=A0A6A6BIT1_9PEZI|nr:uncharacterized protein K452DRAFT_307666 [Aplosporella prunicola CBS 121167]KAF2142737.1 hypothetical protein K452DRAFT_307666 [Aplosporella prunicola CBS 121167]
MSVTASRDPPPLLFAQRSPSPATFAAFPRSSPQSPHSPRSPRFPPTAHAEDIHTPAPTALPASHQEDDVSDDEDDDDASEASDMDGTASSVGAGESQTNHQTGSALEPRTHNAHDAMDTTPDMPGTIQVASLAQAPGLVPAASMDGAPADHSATHTSQTGSTPAPEVNENLVRVNSHGSSVDSGDSRPASLPPPPPPAPIAHLDPPSPRGEHEDSSDDDEDDMPRWREIREDTSVPSEDELREIEAAGEVSALDHEHWESRTFTALNEPEYTAGPSGRFHWTLDHYNGNRENPNKEYLMRSPAANVGGYDWQIKFYPKGNDTEYLSVYVECLSVKKDDDRKDSGPSNQGTAEDATKASRHGAPQHFFQESTPKEYQETPLPLLTDPVLKRPSVAAQVAVVIYNPQEPRVNYYKSCCHRFGPNSTDWGWTRFHGPYEDIHRRHRGQRQALLRNDTLSFTCYIRVVDDETGCLWEHHGRDNRWDNFAMTGLQGLCDPEYSTHDGNIISAISSWMLLRPFREFLYSVTVPDPVTEARKRPKPLLAALQRTLYRMRTDVQPGCEAIDLEEIWDALEWYGFDEHLGKLDVIQLWEILRAKLELELTGTPQAMRFKELFGPERDRLTNHPSYRVPVKNCNDIQIAIDKASNLTHKGHRPPEILHIELERQEFDTSSRTMKKLSDKVAFQDVVDVKGKAYVFYGFVAHKDSLQSGSYYSVLRPAGLGGKWYAYYDAKDENRVVCLTKKAVDMHEGGDPKRPLAYILLFVRNDIASDAFAGSEPVWNVPEWLKRSSEEESNSKLAEGQMIDFEVFDSQSFLMHHGPGMIDPNEHKYQRLKLARTIHVHPTATADVIRAAIASAIERIQDPRQCKFWFFDHAQGTSHRPNLRSSTTFEQFSGQGTEMGMIKSVASDYPERRIWVHVADLPTLPELPKTESNSNGAVAVPADQNSPGTSQDIDHARNTTSSNVHVEDTLMSDPDDDDEGTAEAPTNEQMDVVVAEAAGVVAQAARHHADVSEEMGVAADLLAAGAQGDDTEMGESGSVHTHPPPPPPPVAPPAFIGEDGTVFNIDVVRDPSQPFVNPFDITVPPPPPPVATPPTEEIYFFLKTFDPEMQRLRSTCSTMVKKNEHIEPFIRKIANFPASIAIDIYEEESPTSASPLESRASQSFSAAGLHNACILIAMARLTDTQRDALESRGLFPDPHDYLAYATAMRFAPTPPLNGYYTLDHFSSEWYVGTLVKGKMHGQGTRWYHNGSSYTGSFRLGRRHGQGQLIHANGDVYTGSFAGDLPDGQGSLVEAASGNAYHGGWRGGRRFGEGVTHWRQAEQEERLCRICWEEAADAAFYDCGHVVACLACARRVDQCPVCRRRVLAAMRLYFGN